MQISYGNREIPHHLIYDAGASAVFLTDSLHQLQDPSGATTTTQYQEILKWLYPVNGWAGFSFTDADTYSNAATTGIGGFTDGSAGSGVGVDQGVQYDHFDPPTGTRLSGMAANNCCGITRELRFTGGVVTNDVLAVRVYFTALDKIIPAAGNIWSGKAMTCRVSSLKNASGMTVQLQPIGPGTALLAGSTQISTRDLADATGGLLTTDIAIPPTTLPNNSLLGLDVRVFAGATPAANSTYAFNGCQYFIPSSPGIRVSMIGSAGNTVGRQNLTTQRAVNDYVTAHGITVTVIAIGRNDGIGAGRTTAQYVAEMASLIAKWRTAGVTRFAMVAPGYNLTDTNNYINGVRDALIGLVGSRNDCYLTSHPDALTPSAFAVTSFTSSDNLHMNGLGDAAGAHATVNSWVDGAGQYATGTVTSAAPVVVTINPTIGSTALLTYDFTDPSTGLAADVSGLTWTAIKGDGTVYTPAIGTVAHPATGSYSTSLAFTSGNGYAAGDSGRVTATGTFGGYSWAKVWVYTVGAVGVTVRTITPIVRDINPVQS